MTQKVAILAPVWNYIPIIVPSMVLQKHKKWELHLIHDGESSLPIRQYVESFDDPRLNYIEWLPRRQNFGHPIRKQWLAELRSGHLCADCDYVCITNADNYHAPAYLDHLLSAFKPHTVVTYCSHIAHNYFDYGPLQCTVNLGAIDICACMIKKEVVCEVGWPSMEHSSDWTLLEKILRKHGSGKFVKANGCLVTHN